MLLEEIYRTISKIPSPVPIMEPQGGDDYLHGHGNVAGLFAKNIHRIGDEPGQRNAHQASVLDQRQPFIGHETVDDSVPDVINTEDNIQAVGDQDKQERHALSAQALEAAPALQGAGGSLLRLMEQ